MRYIKSVSLWTVDTAAPTLLPIGSGAHVFFAPNNTLLTENTNLTDDLLLGPIDNEDGRADYCIIEISGRFVVGTTGAAASSCSVQGFSLPDRGDSVLDSTYITNSHPAKASTFTVPRLLGDGLMGDDTGAPIQTAVTTLGVSASLGQLSRNFPFAAAGTIADGTSFHLLFPFGLNWGSDVRISGLRQMHIAIKTVNGGANYTGAPSIAGRIVAHLYEEEV